MEDKKINKVSEITGAVVKKVVNFIILLGVVGLLGMVAWFWHNSQLDKQKIDILEEKIKSEGQVENGHDLEMEKDDLKIAEEGKVSNIENIKTINKEVGSSATYIKDSSELKVYKNEKYGYSFKYPKDWYIYENIDYSECGPEFPKDFEKNAVILSRDKKDVCEVASSTIGYYFGGDIYVNVTETNSNNDVMFSFDEGSSFGEKKYKVGDVEGIMRSVLEKTEYPRWEVTRINARNNGYDYEIRVQQLDDKGNVDPELMEVVNSIVIEK